MPPARKSQGIKSSVLDEADAAVALMRQLSGFRHVRFIILFGSAAEGRMTAESDIDLCIYYEGSRAEAADFRHAVLSRLPGTRVDVQIFQQLPLYVRTEVLRGTLLFSRNDTFLYEKATETLRDFDDFKHRLYDYTGQAMMS